MICRRYGFLDRVKFSSKILHQYLFLFLAVESNKTAHTREQLKTWERAYIHRQNKSTFITKSF